MIRIIQCSKNKNHYFSDHSNRCPWCEINDKDKIEYFPPPVNIGNQVVINPDSNIGIFNSKSSDITPNNIFRQESFSENKSEKRKPSKIGYFGIIIFLLLGLGIVLSFGLMSNNSPKNTIMDDNQTAHIQQSLKQNSEQNLVFSSQITSFSPYGSAKKGAQISSPIEPTITIQSTNPPINEITYPPDFERKIPKTTTETQIKTSISQKPSPSSQSDNLIPEKYVRIIDESGGNNEPLIANLILDTNIDAERIVWKYDNNIVVDKRKIQPIFNAGNYSIIVEVTSGNDTYSTIHNITVKQGGDNEDHA